VQTSCRLHTSRRAAVNLSISRIGDASSETKEGRSLRRWFVPARIHVSSSQMSPSFSHKTLLELVVLLYEIYSSRICRSYDGKWNGIGGRLMTSENISAMTSPHARSTAPAESSFTFIRWKWYPSGRISALATSLSGTFFPVSFFCLHHRNIILAK